MCEGAQTQTVIAFQRIYSSCQLQPHSLRGNAMKKERKKESAGFIYFFFFHLPNVTKKKTQLKATGKRKTNSPETNINGHIRQKASLVFTVNCNTLTCGFCQIAYLKFLHSAQGTNRPGDKHLRTIMRKREVVVSYSSFLRSCSFSELGTFDQILTSHVGVRQTVRGQDLKSALLPAGCPIFFFGIKACHFSSVQLK